jgi:hypothetical protein
VLSINSADTLKFLGRQRSCHIFFCEIFPADSHGFIVCKKLLHVAIGFLVSAPRNLMVGECLCEIEVAVQLGSNDCKHLGPQHSAESTLWKQISMWFQPKNFKLMGLLEHLFALCGGGFEVV